MKSVFVFILVLFCTLAQSHAQVACRELEVPEGSDATLTQYYCPPLELFNEELFYTDDNPEPEFACCQPMSTGYECNPTGLRDNGMFYFNFCTPDDPNEPLSKVCHCRSILAAAIPDLKSALESDDDFDGNCET